MRYFLVTAPLASVSPLAAQTALPQLAIHDQSTRPHRMSDFEVSVDDPPGLDARVSADEWHAT